MELLIEILIDELKQKSLSSNYGVVVIGRNEESGIKNCLESITNQTQTIHFEKHINHFCL